MSSTPAVDRDLWFRVGCGTGARLRCGFLRTGHLPGGPGHRGMPEGLSDAMASGRVRRALRL
jgi:hypothetical protein